MIYPCPRLMTLMNLLPTTVIFSIFPSWIQCKNLKSYITAKLNWFTIVRFLKSENQIKNGPITCRIGKLVAHHISQFLILKDSKLSSHESTWKKKNETLQNTIFNSTYRLSPSHTKEFTFPRLILNTFCFTKNIAWLLWTN